MVTHLTPTHAALRAPRSSGIRSLASALLCAILTLLTIPATHAANTAPTPTIVSAVMRPGTTLMDVIYQVNDPDDATVRVRALAFVDGTRSFAKVLKPVTFVGDTAASLGDAIPTNTPKLLTWNVAADWSIDLGQVKFEILALDSRGLLGFDWITIPAAAGQPPLTISKDSPTDDAVLNALFWLYADNDPGLVLENGVIRGNDQSGVFAGVPLANGAAIKPYAAPFLFKRMNIDPATETETNFALTSARAGILNSTNWHAANRAYGGLALVVGWGTDTSAQVTPSVPIARKLLGGILSISAGDAHVLAILPNGDVTAWGNNGSGRATPPTTIKNVVQVSAGAEHSTAVTADGAVVEWGNNTYGETIVPTGLPFSYRVAAGTSHTLALKADGTVVAWGRNTEGQCTIPTGLSSVIAIAAGWFHNLALKSDRTVMGWGSNGNGQTTIPTGLSGVVAIAARGHHSLALKSDGTVVAWGSLATVPTGLIGVVAIASGEYHNLALKADGTVVGWGSNTSGETRAPDGLGGIAAIAAGTNFSIAVKPKGF